jgi:hypothetical protein
VTIGEQIAWVVLLVAALTVGTIAGSELIRWKDRSRGGQNPVTEQTRFNEAALEAQRAQAQINKETQQQLRQLRAQLLELVKIIASMVEAASRSDRIRDEIDKEKGRRK